MKTNKLTLRTYICLTLILCLLAKFCLPSSPNTQTENTTVLLIAVDLCCSFKVEKFAKRLSFSLTVGT